MSGQTAIIKEPRTQPGPLAVRVPQAGGVLHELRRLLTGQNKGFTIASDRNNSFQEVI